MLKFTLTQAIGVLGITLQARGDASFHAVSRKVLKVGMFQYIFAHEDVHNG